PTAPEISSAAATIAEQPAKTEPEKIEPEKIEVAKATEVEAKSETTPEAKFEALPESKSVSSDPSPVTFASQPESAADLKDAGQQKDSGISHADAIAAIAALEPSGGGSWGKFAQSTGSAADRTSDVPATMAAVAAASGSNGASASGPRWTAVAVALEADEA